MKNRGRLRHAARPPARAASAETVTVVIPTLNENANLQRLLGRLAAAKPPVARIIVSDGGSTDGTPAIALDHGAELVDAAPGRGGQIRRGVAAANGGWLWLLHADTRLPPGWGPMFAAVLAEADPARAYFARLRFATPDMRARLVEFVVRLRCCLFRLPYGDQSLLIHTTLLEAIGGMPDLPLMEDVTLARRLGRARLLPMRLTLETDASAYQRDGWLRRCSGNLWRLLRFLAGCDAAALTKAYRR